MAFPKILFRKKVNVRCKSCIRYYFWDKSTEEDKVLCREFLEAKKEAIIFENDEYLETVTIDQIKNYENKIRIRK